MYVDFKVCHESKLESENKKKNIKKATLYDIIRKLMQQTKL